MSARRARVGAVYALVVAAGAVVADVVGERAFALLERG
jgi:hypothetical protein